MVAWGKTTSLKNLVDDIKYCHHYHHTVYKGCAFYITSEKSAYLIRKSEQETANAASKTVDIYLIVIMCFIILETEIKSYTI
jgi:spore germination protein YaaH